MVAGLTPADGGQVRIAGLDQAADYLEMAARLLRIKAQLLLPRSVEERPTLV